MLEPLNKDSEISNEANLDKLKKFIVDAIGKKVAKLDEVVAKALNINPDAMPVHEQLVNYIESNKSKDFLLPTFELSPELQRYARPDYRYPDFHLSLNFGPGKGISYNVDHLSYLEVNLQHGEVNVMLSTNLQGSRKDLEFTHTRVRFFQSIKIDKYSTRNNPFLRYEYEFLYQKGFGTNEGTIPAFLHANNNNIRVWAQFTTIDESGIAHLDINELDINSEERSEFTLKEANSNLIDKEVKEDPAFLKAYNSSDVGVIYIFEYPDKVVVKTKRDFGQPDIVIYKQLDIPNMPIFSIIDNVINPTLELDSGESEREFGQLNEG